MGVGLLSWGARPPRLSGLLLAAVEGQTGLSIFFLFLWPCAAERALPLLLRLLIKVGSVRGFVRACALRPF